METRGKLKDISMTLSGKMIVSFEVEKLSQESIDMMQGCDDLDITAEKHREKRSLNANALLWECIGRIAAALRTDKWEIYLKMLKRYGKYTYICVKPQAVEMMKHQWRECEEVGTIDINGEKAVQLLCYFGSSTYDTKQFSVLLDGVISEMKEMGLETPSEKKLTECIKRLEAQNG